MSSTRPCLAELSVEILEQILLYLPIQDIIRMETVGRLFLDVIFSSPALQYRRELFAAGLIDNPHSPCDLTERRRLCKEYVHKWSDAANLAKDVREVLLEQKSGDWGPGIPGRNLLVGYHHESNAVNLIHIPPAMSRKPIEQWSLPPFQFRLFGHTTYPPKDVLVAVEERGMFIHLHLLNLLDGSPYRISPSNVITWALPPECDESDIENLAMTASRLVMCIAENPQFETVWRIIAWDWETGDLVLNCSTVDRSGLIRELGYWPAFLDEFRIMLLQDDEFCSDFELIVFNTFVPQDHPGSVRRFKFWPDCRGRNPCRSRYDRTLGMVYRDVPLMADPTQAVFVMELSPEPPRPGVFLVLRVQPLIEIACSSRTDVQIPWDEWGRGSVIMEVPEAQVNPICLITIHGAHVLVMCYGALARSLHVFDFSRRGCAALPPSDENGFGTERRVAFKDGRSCMLEEGGGDRVSGWGVQIGDSIIAVAQSPEHPPASEVWRILDLT